MKKITMAVLALILVLGSFTPNTASAQYYDGYDDRDRDMTYQDFYDGLSPYGQWVEYPGQGYVWVPDAESDFQPYSTNGHWVWSDDYEWMWVSDYDWGWAPFHYGRWDHDAGYGWYWVPGYEWSPAWVAWRDGGDYYGWAPIRPGINISVNFNIGGYNPPNSFWCFAPRRYINSPRIYDYYVDRRQNLTIINQTTVIVNNYRYGGNYGFRSGPRRYDAEVYCGRINPVRFRQSNTPGRSSFRNNEVSMFRPNVRRDEGRNFAPRQFERYDRNGGNFRNNNGNRREDNGGINNRRPDSRDQANNNRSFDRQGNDRFRDRNTTERPVDNNRSFDRRDDNTNRNRDNNGGMRRDDGNRQPDNNRNSPFDRSRTDRTDNPGRQPMDRRVDNPQGNPNRQPVDRRIDNPQGNPNRQPVDRRIDNPQGNPNRNMEPGGRPTREPAAQPDNRGFERRNTDNNPGRTREVRTNDQPRQPQQIERRSEPRPQPQVERRQESRPQPQMDRPQSQPRERSFERRSDDGGGRQRESAGGNNGGGNNGGGRRGRF